MVRLGEATYIAYRCNGGSCTQRQLFWFCLLCSTTVAVHGHAMTRDASPACGKLRASVKPSKPHPAPSSSTRIPGLWSRISCCVSSRNLQALRAASHTVPPVVVSLVVVWIKMSLVQASLDSCPHTLASAFTLRWDFADMCCLAVEQPGLTHVATVQPAVPNMY